MTSASICKVVPRLLRALAVAASLLAPCLASGQDTLSFRLTAVNEEGHSVLRWQSLGAGVTYYVYRRMPWQEAFELRRTTTDYTMADAVEATVCDDSVVYCVQCTVDGTPYRSNRQGVHYDDDLPTTSCSFRVVSVDTATQRLTLTWNPSPDPDIFGYVVHMKDNVGRWMGLDTVWGKEQTRYVAATLSPDTLHAFRLFAFDSCYQASPLTEPCHNVVLRATLPPCSRSAEVAWNLYDNMPGGIEGYYLLAQDGDGPWRATRVETTQARHVLPEGADRCRLLVMVTPEQEGGDTVFSNMVELRIEMPDSAAYLRLDEATVADDNSAVVLRGRVDTSFHGVCSLYRRLAQEESWALLDTLPRHQGAEEVGYVDAGAHPTQQAYLYRLGARGGCLGGETFSDSVGSLLIRLDTTLPAAAVRWDSIPHALSYALRKYPCGGDTCYRLVAAMPRDTVQSNLVRHVPKVTIFFPSAILPGQGANGLFLPASPNLSPEGYALYVYSRNGQLVFSASLPSEGWDGTQGGAPLPAGAYAYVVFFRSQGKPCRQAGTVTLIR